MHFNLPTNSLGKALRKLGSNGNLTVWKENYNWWGGSIGGTFEGGFCCVSLCEIFNGQLKNQYVLSFHSKNVSSLLHCVENC
jgi:hypothetical protein